MGGVNKLSLNPSVDNKERAVKKVGNFSPSGHYGKNAYADDGLCPALTTYKSDYWVCVRYEKD